MSKIFLVFLVFVSYSHAQSQSISHLVRWNSIKNTQLAAKNVHKSVDNIFTIYEYIRRDTLYFEGKPLGTDTLPFEQFPLLISKHGPDHQLMKTGVFTTARRFGGNMNYQNARYLKGHIYVFVSIHDEVLRYNGETIWTGTPANNTKLDHWFIMVKLDEDLNFMEAKGIDHWSSGFEDVAMTEDRMYLFGRISNGMNLGDTVDVEGYKLTAISDFSFGTTNFVLAYDRHTGQVLGDTRINVRSAEYYLKTSGAGIGKDGTVYQMVNTANNMLLEDGTTILGYFNRYNTTLFQYDKNGELKDYVSFISNNGSDTYLDKMVMDTKGDIYIHGRVAINLGNNGETIEKLPLPQAAMTLCLDGGDMELNWYDYISVQHTNTASIYGDALSVDEEDNVYVSSSFTNGVTASIDKNEQSVLPGTHIIKYDKNGHKMMRSRWENRQEEPIIHLTGGENDKITVFKHQDADRGQFDSLSMETSSHYNQMFLFSHELGQISSIIDEGTENKIAYQLYPNPVHKHGILHVKGWTGEGQGRYRILNARGEEICQGHLNTEGQIDLQRCQTKAGIYWVEVNHPALQLYKLIVTE